MRNTVFGAIRATSLAALCVGAFATAGCCGTNHEKSCGGDKSAAEKGCSEKKCGAEKSCGEKSCGEKSCGEKSCGQK